MKTGAKIVSVGGDESDKSIIFDHNASYFITAGKIDDNFNTSFSLQANFVVNEATTAFVVIGWRGMDYLLATIPIESEEYPCSGQMWVGWEAEEVPTIRELLTTLGEQIKETTNYSYMWKTGYLVNQTEGYVTDDWDANLLVHAVAIPWNIILPVVAVSIVGLGIIVTKKDKLFK